MLIFVLYNKAVISLRSF